jgi:hypothetical protein
LREFEFKFKRLVTIVSGNTAEAKMDEVGVGNPRNGMANKQKYSIADVAQIHPGMNREEPTRTTSLQVTGTGPQALGMAPASPYRGFQIAKDENGN